jgi:hypothetical protein
MVIAAALRIATGDTATDNFSQGNMIAPIHLGSGRLGSAAYKKEGVGVRLDFHPATRAPISGQIVPLWQEALSEVQKAAAFLPWTPVLGWDVAITPSGPVIVEANGLWDPDVTQIAYDEGLLETPLMDFMRDRGLLTKLGLGTLGRGVVRVRAQRSLDQ